MKCGDVVNIAHGCKHALDPGRLRSRENERGREGHWWGCFVTPTLDGTVVSTLCSYWYQCQPKPHRETKCNAMEGSDDVTCTEMCVVSFQGSI